MLKNDKANYRQSTPQRVIEHGQNLSPFSTGQNTTLMMWGPIQFQVWPLNYNEMDHETSTDWAKKEIAGAALYREWVGENDEIIYLRGELFPYRLGGLMEADNIDGQRRKGIANMLIRGNGDYIGWYVIEKFIRSHQFIGGEGIGQKVHFEAVFVRVPVPDNTTYLSQLWQSGVIG